VVITGRERRDRLAELLTALPAEDDAALNLAMRQAFNWQRSQGWLAELATNDVTAAGRVADFLTLPADGCGSFLEHHGLVFGVGTCVQKGADARTRLIPWTGVVGEGLRDSHDVLMLQAFEHGHEQSELAAEVVL
jgi:hypothetical protein